MVRSRTLVIVLGQLRAHQLTWANFKTNLLDQLGADLAVCVPNDASFDFTNPFYTHARFRWLIPDTPDLAPIFDWIGRLIGSDEDWRSLLDVEGIWLGRIAQSGQESASAILYVLRWFMLSNVEASRLTDVYDRFVITRSDFYYLCPHPPLDCLDPDRLWIPDGEDYAGICDRHLVVSSSHLSGSCNILEELLRHPRELRERMIGNGRWNTEKVLALHLARNGLMSKVRRFPYVMFLVRSEGDPPSFSPGQYVPGLTMTVRYVSELHEAVRYGRVLTSAQAWRFFFAVRHLSARLPAHIYTNHGTIIYFDAATSQPRHGAIASSPKNLFFVLRRPGEATIIHKTADATHELAWPDVAAGTTLKIIPVKPGSAPDQSMRTNNLVGLMAGDSYLSAQLDGLLSWRPSQCRAWEHFRLVADLGALQSLEWDRGRER
jgi:hypothetical protein